MSRGLVILALCLIPLAGMAQQVRGRGGPDEVWKALAGKHDADGDGRISRDEYPRGEERFRALDRNRDGVLSSEDVRGGAGHGGLARTIQREVDETDRPNDSSEVDSHER